MSCDPNPNLDPNLDPPERHEVVAVVEHGLIAFLYKGSVTWPILQAIDTRAAMAHSTHPGRLLPSTSLLGLSVSLGLEELTKAVQHHHRSQCESNNRKGSTSHLLPQSRWALCRKKELHCFSMI